MKKSREYIDRILDTPPPQTMHQLMQFMGLVNFQRRFIKGCSELTKPLTDAIDHKSKNLKKTEINWTPDMKKAFSLIKQELAKDVSLAFPDTSEDAEPLELYVDASRVAISSSLFQKQHGHLRPLSFMSKLLGKAELNYSIYDKEILALVRGITSHRQFLIGRKFKLFTDCKNIVLLFQMKNCSPRLLRLLDQLAEYTFDIFHISGLDNYISDALSRLEEYTSPDFFKRIIEEAPAEIIPPGFIEKAVPGGTDSPFFTIQYLIESLLGQKIALLDLREILIDEILYHPEKYNLKGEEKKMQNIRSMRKPGVSTYVIIFQAAANYFK